MIKNKNRFGLLIIIMTKYKVEYIIAICAISIFSAIIYIISISSNFWIISLAFHNNASKNSEINYGLFSGSLISYILNSPRYYNLKVTCDYNYGACFYSCQQNIADREKELQLILRNEKLQPCAPIPRMKADVHINSYNYIKSKDIKELPSQQYITSSYWASTVAFVFLSFIFTIISAAFAFINLKFNPIHEILSIFGLYVWNGLSIGFGILVMIIWGSLYTNFLKRNIAITDTLNSEITYDSEGYANLGYSYYLILLAITLNSINIGLLLYRRKLLNDDPPPVITYEDNENKTVEFY